MSSAQLALRSGLIAVLKTAPDVAALLGEGDVHDGAPRAAVFPYVSLGRIDSRAMFPGEPAGEVHDVRLETAARGESRDQAAALAEAAVTALLATSPAVSGHYLVDLTAVSVASQRLKDGRGYRTETVLRAVTEPHI